MEWLEADAKTLIKLTFDSVRGYKDREKANIFSEFQTTKFCGFRF